MQFEGCKHYNRESVPIPKHTQEIVIQNMVCKSTKENEARFFQFSKTQIGI